MEGVRREKLEVEVDPEYLVCRYLVYLMNPEYLVCREGEVSSSVTEQRREGGEEPRQFSPSSLPSPSPTAPASPPPPRPSPAPLDFSFSSPR